MAHWNDVWKTAAVMDIAAFDLIKSYHPHFCLAKELFGCGTIWDNYMPCVKYGLEAILNSRPYSYKSAVLQRIAMVECALDMSIDGCDNAIYI